VVGVIAELEIHILQDHKAHSDADGQTEDIDERINFPFHQISTGNQKVVLNHRSEVAVFG
jgi:hypothetical protein